MYTAEELYVACKQLVTEYTANSIMFANVKVVCLSVPLHKMYRHQEQKNKNKQNKFLNITQQCDELQSFKVGYHHTNII